MLCFQCKGINLTSYVEIQFTTRIFKEGRTLYCPGLGTGWMFPRVRRQQR